jgi:hypothetical protein
MATQDEILDEAVVSPLHTPLTLKNGAKRSVSISAE